MRSASISSGGTDCDNEDPAIYPGAPDLWYDGIDSNCDYQSDFDQDGDFDDSGDFDGFADVIDECCKIDFSLYKKMGISGKSYAYDNFQLRSLIDKILENF